jgi:hypothetical protein
MKYPPTMIRPIRKVIATADLLLAWAFKSEA